jgi:hypothetical protein
MLVPGTSWPRDVPGREGSVSDDEPSDEPNGSTGGGAGPAAAPAPDADGTDADGASAAGLRVEAATTAEPAADARSSVAARPRTPRQSTPRRRLTAVTVAAAVLLAGVGAAGLRHPPGRPGGLVILYGDSLATEASGAFVGELARTSDAEMITRPVPGAAPCDAIEAMQADLALRPTVVVIQFAGNSASDCSRGPGGERLTGRAHLDRTIADVRAATELFATRGTRVVLVGGPDVPGLPGNPGLPLADAYNLIVNEWAGRDLGRVRYADAAATVSGPDHSYVDRLACHDGEGEDEGCIDGEVVVRSDDRIHLCPRPDRSLVCPVPSPGARRFGEEMARVARQALDPDY